MLLSSQVYRNVRYLKFIGEMYVTIGLKVTIEMKVTIGCDSSSEYRKVIIISQDGNID